MSDEAGVLVMFFIWGWIPILAVGKAISWIVAEIRFDYYEYFKSKRDDEVQE